MPDVDFKAEEFKKCTRELFRVLRVFSTEKSGRIHLDWQRNEVLVRVRARNAKDRAEIDKLLEQHRTKTHETQKKSRTNAVVATMSIHQIIAFSETRATHEIEEVLSIGLYHAHDRELFENLPNRTIVKYNGKIRKIRRATSLIEL